MSGVPAVERGQPQPPPSTSTTASSSVSSQPTASLPTPRTRAAINPTPSPNPLPNPIPPTQPPPSRNPFDESPTHANPPPHSRDSDDGDPRAAEPSLNPFLDDDGELYEEEMSEEGGSPRSPLNEEEEGEEGEEEGEEEVGGEAGEGEGEGVTEGEGEADDASHSASISSSLSSLSPLSSLLTSINPSSSLPPDFCHLSGTWRVDRSRSDSLSSLLAALSVPPHTRRLIDEMDVLTTLHHDPLQHAFTIIDVSAAGQHVTTLNTDGVVRSTVDKAGKVVVRRAFEEEEEDEEESAESGEKRHQLRGGVVRVETKLANNVEMVDTRVLVERALMMQQTVLRREGKVLCRCRRVYQKVESEEQREREEKEWKEKEDITRLMREAKQRGPDAQLAEGAAAEQERYDENGNLIGMEEEEEEEEGEEETETGHMEGAEELGTENEDDDGSSDLVLPTPPSSTSASPEATPSNSPLPVHSVSLPPPPPPPDFHASINGTWSVLKNYSQDVTPILKKMGVSWMDRSMSSAQDQVLMNVGRSILVCVDRSSLGTAELRYVIDGQWHDGMSFGGKEGKVRVTIERSRSPFSISIETQWLKDKRSRFQQLVEPNGPIHYNPQAPPGRRGIPIGFVVCQLMDVRVLERRAIVKQMLHYIENEAVRLVCVRYLRKVETAAERRRSEEQEKARQDYERLRAAYEQRTQHPHSSEKKEAAQHSSKLPKRKKQPRQPSAADEAEADRIERLTSIDEQKPTSPARYTGPFRRMSMGVTMSAGVAAGMGAGAAVDGEEQVTQPNPLLTFLPIRLVLEGSRGGQLYQLMAMLLLACWCADNRWATAAFIALSAFHLHYVEVLGRERSVKRDSQAEQSTASDSAGAGAGDPASTSTR